MIKNLFIRIFIYTHYMKIKLDKKNNVKIDEM